MNQDRENKPADQPVSDGEEREEKGRKNRDEMDQPPAPGTDPLHEGP